MKKTSAFISLLVGAGLLASAAQAADVDKAIKARKAVMQVYAFNIGLVGAMAKGAAEYNAETAQNAADNLLAVASMKNGAMWPQGSDNATVGEDATRALPEIWTTYPAIGEAGAAMIEALTEFTMVAGQGLDQMRGGLGAVGKGCKGCHEDFRAEKN